MTERMKIIWKLRVRVLDPRSTYPLSEGDGPGCSVRLTGALWEIQNLNVSLFH
jgi:hypothetical protein